MAIRLDKAFGADMETLMRMQSSYDIAQAKKRKDLVEVSAAAWRRERGGIKRSVTKTTSL